MHRGSERPRPNRRLTAGFVVVLVSGLTAATGALPASADWVDNNCTVSGGNNSGAVSRATAASFFISVAWEGYHWAGGCWNTNNVDDSPGEPQKTEFPRGEGPDCSGFVWKAWMLKAASTTAFYYNPRNKYVHGPEVASSYRSSTTAWTVVSGADLYWDAFASTDHVAVLQSAYTGGGLFYEAKSEAAGSGLWGRDYNVNSSFTQSRRNGWTG